MSIRSVILEEITRVAAQQDRTLAPLHDDLPLLNTGLDSLGIAVLVAALDDRLDLDPFSGNVSFPVTLGDFIALYENVAV